MKTCFSIRLVSLLTRAKMIYADAWIPGIHKLFYVTNYAVRKPDAECRGISRFGLIAKVYTQPDTDDLFTGASSCQSRKSIMQTCISPIEKPYFARSCIGCTLTLLPAASLTSITLWFIAPKLVWHLADGVSGPATAKMRDRCRPYSASHFRGVDKSSMDLSFGLMTEISMAALSKFESEKQQLRDMTSLGLLVFFFFLTRNNSFNSAYNSYILCQLQVPDGRLNYCLHFSRRHMTLN